MKKNSIKLLFLGMVAAIGLSSCQKDLEIWDSATRQYAGKYVYALYSEDMQKQYKTYAAGGELWIFNSAKNVPDEIWLQDEAGLIGLKTKYNITGDASLFKSVTDDYNSLPNNLAQIDPDDYDDNYFDPTAENQEYAQPRQYVRSAIVEAKIIPNVVTTKGGNVADSIYIKLKTYGATVKFKSYKTPESTWQKEGVPEFAWKFDSVTPDPEGDETLVISGYRYTGFTEDDY